MKVRRLGSLKRLLYISCLATNALRILIRPDYIAEAIKKVSKIHARLPAGGILVFLTGQNEISGVCKKLEAKYGAKALAAKKARRRAPRDDDSGTTEERPRRIGASLGETEILHSLFTIVINESFSGC